MWMGNNFPRQGKGRKIYCPTTVGLLTFSYEFPKKGRPWWGKRINLYLLEDKTLQLSERHAVTQLLGKRKGQRKILFQIDATSSDWVSLFENSSYVSAATCSTKSHIKRSSPCLAFATDSHHLWCPEHPFAGWISVLQGTDGTNKQKLPLAICVL